MDELIERHYDIGRPKQDKSLYFKAFSSGELKMTWHW